MAPVLLPLLLATSISRPALAYGPWHSSKIGGGGYIQGVAIAPSDPRRYYAWVDVGGVYRSDDGGKTWRMLLGNFPPRSGSQPVRAFSVDPRNADRILVGTGDHWQKGPEGLWASDDGGQSFRKVLVANYLGNSDYRWAGLLLARDPKNPSVLLTATMGTGVFRSEDNGKTWTKQGLEGVCATDVRFDRRNPRRAWVCALPYNSWLFGNPKAGLKGGFYRTDDGGKSWTKLSDESPSEILQDPAHAWRLIGIFGGGGLIRSSNDGGNTWQPFAEGLPTPKANPRGPSEQEFQALAAGPDFVLTASTHGTFYRRGRSDAKWTKLAAPDVEELYFGEPWYGGWEGKGWRHHGKALASITVDPRDPRHWLFTDWYALWRSPNAGESWELSMDGIEVTVLHVLQQDPSNPNLVHLGMADNGYMRSENGAERFTPGKVNSNMKSLSLSPRDPSVVYGVGDPANGQWVSNTVYVSRNRGRTWERAAMLGLPDMEAHHSDTIVVAPSDPKRLYLAVSGAVGDKKGGVYTSVDGGRNWTWMGKGLNEGKPFFEHDIWVVGREIAASVNGELLAISRSERALYRYEKGEKGGWVEVRRFGGNPNCVVAHPTRGGAFLLAVEGEGVYRSVDGGRTWTHTLRTSARHVAYDLAKPGRVAAGADGAVMLSEDGGGTWRALDKRLPNRLSPVVTFAGDRLIVGTGGSGAFWMTLPSAKKGR